ncbi:hypothetical protein [Vibrio parahaemolyticus]|uniref:hypothetical protein n=1 Tax=Vibrio parahaemolyticus TaxID=670 RepID=UPI00186A0A1C|nr:hypothetical protein [Vibrio parahaemolyticus]MBE3844758.1 hypothetical protein [Vibrio parahaemolyticus]MBE3945714.1 hypothetical protein [Vibrio parahaemolyticus]MBE4120781.1 hypothetical protein [Vibrio parahaemolyticus]MBE4781597.1 hypothetical protein [Vibrio parahaemolyticus]MEA5290589.1 hypothetical protein [Vibrio parahaemolyticus]
MWCKSSLLNVVSNSGLDVKDLIDSVFRTLDIFEYHKEEAYSIIQKIEPADGEQALTLVLSSNDELYFDQLSLQAHIQAAIHNVRSVYDLLAQLINKLLLSDPLKIHECDINKLINRLGDSPVKDAIIAAINTESYAYINSFVNVIKHRNLVVLNPEVNFEELKAGIRFSSFKYKAKNYPSLWAVDALQESLNVKNQIVTIGEILNNHLCLHRV